MGKEPEKILNDFREQMTSFLGLKLELLKLNACERAAKIIAALTHSFLLVLLGLFVILFLFLSLGFYLGELTGRLSLGFLIASLIYLGVLLIVYYLKKSIRLKITNIVIGCVMEKEEEEGKDRKEDKEEKENSYKDNEQHINTPAETTAGQTRTSDEA